MPRKQANVNRKKKPTRRNLQQASAGNAKPTVRSRPAVSRLPRPLSAPIPKAALAKARLASNARLQQSKPPKVKVSAPVLRQNHHKGGGYDDWNEYIQHAHEGVRAAKEWIAGRSKPIGVDEWGVPIWSKHGHGFAETWGRHQEKLTGLQSIEHAGKRHHVESKTELGHSAQKLMRSAPAAFSTQMPAMGYSTHVGTHGKDSITVKGSDYVAVITSALADQEAGSTIITLDINPRNLGLQRLQALSSLYEQFEIDIEFVYAPAVGSDTKGGFVCYFEMDPDDSLAPGLSERLKNAYGHAGVTTGNWWTPMVVRMPKKKGKFYVDAGNEPRMTTQARFQMLVEIDGNPTTDVGVLYCTYTCHLFRSKLDSTSVGNGSYWSGRYQNGTATAALPIALSGLNPADWTTSPGSTLTPPLVTVVSTTDNRLFIPVTIQGPFLLQIFWDATTATTVTSEVANLTAISSNEYWVVTAGSGTANFLFERAYQPTTPNKVVAGDQTNTYITLHLTTLTSPNYVYVRYIALDYTSRVNQFKRLENQAEKLKSQLDALVTNVRCLETEEQKIEEPSLADEDLPDIEDCHLSASKHRRPRHAIKSRQDETLDRKEGFESLDRSLSRKRHNNSPRSNDSLSQTERKLESKERRVSLGSYDGIEELSTAQELSLLPQREADRRKGASVQRDADPIVSTPGGGRGQNVVGGKVGSTK